MAETKETIPHVQAVRLAMQSLEPLVYNALGWNKITYNQFQFDAGIRFIESLEEVTPEEKVLLLNYGGSGFWKWWRFRWYLRDQEVYHNEELTEANYLKSNSPGILKQGEQPLSSFYNYLGFFITEAEKSKAVKNSNNEGL